MFNLTTKQLHEGVYRHEPRGGFTCRACEAGAPCSWQVQHTAACPWKTLERWLPQTTEEHLNIFDLTPAELVELINAAELAAASREALDADYDVPVLGARARFLRSAVEKLKRLTPLPPDGNEPMPRMTTYREGDTPGACAMCGYSRGSHNGSALWCPA